MATVKATNVKLFVDGKEVGSASEIIMDIDPLVDVEVGGTFPDGSKAGSAIFQIPQSVVDQGHEAMKDYIFNPESPRYKSDHARR